MLSSCSVEPYLLIQAVSGIPHSTTVAEFQLATGIRSQSSALKLIRYLNENGIGRLWGNTVKFEIKDKLNLILNAMSSGCTPELLSSKLNWKDFELFTTLILEKNGYRIKTNINFGWPKIQIDVVGKLPSVCLIIDCKHWKCMPFNSMQKVAVGQIRRTQIYLQKRKIASATYPIIVTLNETKPMILNGVPFVPIASFNTFLVNHEFYDMIA